MKSVYSGEVAAPGVYLSLRHVDLRVVSGGESLLEGPAGAVYKRLPLVAVVVLGPLVGGMFAVALPLIIFLAVLRAAFEHLRHFRVYRAGQEVRWGVYLGLTRPAVRYVVASGELLDGHAGTAYLRVPTLLVLIGCPLIGLLYAVLFPALLGVALVVTVGQLVYHTITGRPIRTPLGGATDMLQPVPPKTTGAAHETTREEDIA